MELAILIYLIFPVLKEEPDDLTHLAPSGGDTCVPLEVPLLYPGIDDMLSFEPANTDVTEEFSALFHVTEVPGNGIAYDKSDNCLIERQSKLTHHDNGSKINLTTSNNFQREGKPFNYKLVRFGS